MGIAWIFRYIRVPFTHVLRFSSFTSYGIGSFHSSSISCFEFLRESKLFIFSFLQSFVFYKWWRPTPGGWGPRYFIPFFISSLIFPIFFTYFFFQNQCLFILFVPRREFIFSWNSNVIFPFSSHYIVGDSIFINLFG